MVDIGSVRSRLGEHISPRVFPRLGNRRPSRQNQVKHHSNEISPNGAAHKSLKSTNVCDG